ncbi:uncharacterized protein LOC132264146 [Phlebotomus argentipes]|uniref:uncharacterized protein LOC132264146 n=1 Tax=Phlebotomus argentipes TaxID=94469 RepID=UPI002892C6BA|nr:uncharacterized protein LOC132264146 [Phlebotomus argentipes]
MAKLLAYYTLCPVNDSREFLGVSADAEDGAIINTLARNIVIITKLKDQKQIRSWTVLEKLSNKVVFDGESGKYVGVFGHRSLKCWSDSETNLKKIRKVKLQKNVKDLVTFGDNRETLVLFEDGTSVSLSAVITNTASLKDGLLGQDYDIEHPKVLTTLTGEFILAYFAKNLVTKDVEAHFYVLESASHTPVGNSVRINLRRGDQHSKLVGYTVTEGLVLITIWSDKRIFRRAIRFDEEEDGPGQFIAMLSAVSVEQPLSVISVSPDYLAIYGANIGQEGSSLILYNVLFNVAQAKQFFKVYFNNSRLFVVDSNILIVAGQTLAVVPFRISKAQLADMVGSQKSPQKFREVEKDYINEEDELEQEIELDSRNFLGQEDEDIQEVALIRKERDFQFNRRVFRVTSEEKFAEHLSLLKRRSIALQFVEKSHQDGVEVKVFTHPHATVFSRKEFEFLATELEVSGASEYEISNKLISLTLASDTIDEATNCLRRYSCVSEERLVNCLIYALDKQNWDFLLTVLSVDFSHEFLVEELRSQLNADHVNSFLKQLLAVLEESELEERPMIGDRVWDGDERIIQWFTALLDAHYHHLVMCGDEKIEKCLKKWRKAISSFHGNINELTNLSPVLYSISQNKTISQTQGTAKWYTIEVVQLY